MGAAEHYRELLEAERMAASLAGVAEDRGGQYLGPLALNDLAEADIFEIRKRVQPARVKGGIRDDRNYQIFQTVLCLRFKSSTGDLDAIFSSRRTRA